MKATTIDYAILASQFLMFLFYAIFGQYEQYQFSQEWYNLFQDINVIIFIGYGYLLAFLKKYSWSAIVLNYFIAAWCIQLGVFMVHFWGMAFSDTGAAPRKFVWMSIFSFINAEYGAGAVIITLSVLLGRCSFYQAWAIATLEIIFWSFNREATLQPSISISDAGGTITVHLFGACFGIAASYFYDNKKANADLRSLRETTYITSLFAMLGTLFLFVYWPSWNSAVSYYIFTTSLAQMNTILCMVSSVIASIIASRILIGNFTMEIILRATLSGGVMIGASSNILQAPCVAILFGQLIGVVSVLGFSILNQYLKKRLQLSDTCGTLYLHGIPGFLGGFLSVIVIGARGLGNAGGQFLGLFITLCISISSGWLTGFITSKPWFQGLESEQFFDDTVNWNETDLIQHFISNQLSQDSTKQNQVDDVRERLLIRG